MATQNEDKPVAGPNPELYDQLSQPYASRAVADAKLDRFIAEVQNLRAQHGIPEVIIVCAAHFKPEDGSKETAACKAFGLGHPDFHAQLGALAFQAYTWPEIARGDKLRAIARGKHDALTEDAED